MSPIQDIGLIFFKCNEWGNSKKLRYSLMILMVLVVVPLSIFNR